VTRISRRSKVVCQGPTARKANPGQGARSVSPPAERILLVPRCSALAFSNQGNHRLEVRCAEPRPGRALQREHVELPFSGA
jgi:hypothetical protein